jgi:hypothetical protein
MTVIVFFPLDFFIPVSRFLFLFFVIVFHFPRPLFDRLIFSLYLEVGLHFLFPVPLVIAVLLFWPPRARLSLHFAIADLIVFHRFLSIALLAVKIRAGIMSMIGVGFDIIDGSKRLHVVAVSGWKLRTKKGVL